MKKLIKFFAAISLLVLVLVVASAVAIAVLIDPNDYRNKITQLALEEANLELRIGGDIGWSFYPSLGIDIAKIKAKIPGQDALISLKRARVAVMLKPLLFSEVQVKSINIEGLNLSLVKDTTGNNWQSAAVLGNSDQDSTAKTAATATSNTDLAESEKKPPRAAFKLDIQSINIDNANITYTDKTTGESTLVSGLNLTTERVILGQPFNAQANFNIKQRQADKSTLDAGVSLNATFIIDTLKQRYQLNNFTSQLTIKTDREITVNLAANLDANLAANSITADNLKINVLELSATGAVSVTGDNLSIINANLNLAPFDLKAVMNSLNLTPFATSDDQSLRNISLGTKISGSPTQLNFDALNITLDKTRINGAANYNLENNMVGFNLKGDALNLNAYLPDPTPKRAVKAESPATHTAGYSKDDVIDLQLLRNINANGQLSFDQLTYQKTKIANLTLSLDAKAGLLKIPKLNMQVYGGSISNDITLDARDEILAISIANSINKLQLGPLLNDFASTDTLSGYLSTVSKLRAQGQSVDSIVNSLAGQVKFNLADGVIKGINAAQQMCETVNKISSLGGTIASTEAVNKSTPFANIDGLFNVQNGLISNNDFRAALDAIKVTGKGTVNLPLQSLNYRLGLKIADNLFKKSCSVNNKIQGIEWPIDCKGKFSDDPLQLCRPDLSVVKTLAEKMLKEQLEKKLGISLKAKEQELKAQLKAKQQALKAQAEAKKKELQEAVQEKLKDKLQGALKGLF